MTPTRSLFSMLVEIAKKTMYVIKQITKYSLQLLLGQKL